MAHLLNREAGHFDHVRFASRKRGQATLFPGYRIMSCGWWLVEGRDSARPPENGTKSPVPFSGVSEGNRRGRELCLGDELLTLAE